MLKKITVLLCALAMLIGLYAVTAAADAASAVAAIGTQYFDTLEEAVDAVDAANPEQYVITLYKDVTSAAVDQTVYIDLAGKNIATLDVAKDVTVYCLDSETDDYEIAGDAINGFSGFGRIAAVTGEGKVAGVEAGMIPVEPSEEYMYGTLDSYLMVDEENKGLSFHRVNLQITEMNLRAKEDGAKQVNPGVYYKSAFGGDAMVAEHVKTFGIALSITEEPNASNMGLTNAYSWFEGAYFNAGLNDGDNTSTLLKNVMKESNAKLRNASNANIGIYGKAYIETTENTYVFGVCANRTLKEQTVAANNRWDDYDADKQATLTAMYDKYFNIMKDWSVENIVEGYEAEEAKVLKVLTLGHSLGLDSNHMLNLIADSQGIKQYDEMVIGSLYYSGCPLWRHAGNLYDNDPEYSLHLSSTADTSKPLQSIPNVTIAYAIDYDYWDIIIMQGGVWEIGQDEKYKDGHIQTIQNYIEKNKRNPELYLGWNMTWCPPVDDSLTNDSYKSNYTNYFNRDRALMYNNITRCVQSYIATDDHFKFIVPAATIFENALTSYLTEKDIHRDYVHATDLTRVMVSHAFYCRIFGVEQLDEIKVDVIPGAFRKNATKDWVLTDAEKALILEAVNNALKTPFEVTQSEYEIDYSSRKILGIGNSFTADSMRMLQAIYEAEDFDKNVTLGYAYNAGCSLEEHVGYINNNEAKYYYYYLNEDDEWKYKANVTLEYILQQEDWEYVSLQQASTYSGVVDTYNAEHIATIKNCVETNLGYEPVYMWNMTWAYPEVYVNDNGETVENTTNTFTNTYGGSQETMYNMIVDCVKEKIVTDPEFEYLMPVGTAIQNAKTSFLGDLDLHRDNLHLNDLGRLFAGYVWYCEMEKVTLDEIKLTTVPDALVSYIDGDLVVSEAVAKVIVESVNNAMNNKFAVTQSQFTEAQ